MHSIAKLAIIGAAVAVQAAVPDDTTIAPFPLPSSSPHSIHVPTDATILPFPLPSSSPHHVPTDATIPPYPLPSTITSITTITNAQLPHPIDDSCPTVIHTEKICNTCIQPMCLHLSTLTVGCDCTAGPATSTTAYGCEGACPTGCPTSYTVVTATDCAKITTVTLDIQSSGSDSASNGGPNHTSEPSGRPSGSTPPPAASSGPVEARAGKVGAFSFGGMAVVLGAWMLL